MSEFFASIDWGNVPQWGSFIGTMFVAIFVSSYSNKLKEYELREKKTQEWLDKTAPVLRFLHWLKRNLQKSKYSDTDIVHYQTVLDETIWNTLPWEMSQEGWLLLVERNLQILRDQPNMEKRKLIVESFVASLEGMQHGIAEQMQAEAHEDANK